MHIEETGQMSRRAKIGWGILLTISALMLLNGVGWFISGPGMNAAYSAEVAEMSVDEFRGRFPGLVAHQARNVRQVAVWYATFGAMALMVSLRGFRHGTRWAWNAAWPVIAAPIAIGIVYTPAGQLNAEGSFLIAVGAVALLGQLLARPKQRSYGSMD